MSIIVLIFIFNVFNSHAESVDINNELTCVTEICNKTAAGMKKMMNPEIDPCIDFYQYACGNWPTNVVDSDSYTAIKNRIYKKLKEIVLTVPSSEKNTSLAKIKMFYDSCMNTDKIESEGISDLLRIMDENGGWPMIMSENDWMMKKKPWLEVDLEFRKVTNRSPIFSLSVLEALDEKLSPVAKLDYQYLVPGHFPDRFDTFIALPHVLNYMNIIKNVSKVIANHRNFSMSEETLENDVKDIMKFKWESNWIVRNSINNSDGGGYSFDTISIDDFQKTYNSTCCKTENSKINWLHVIRQYCDDISNVVNGSQTIMVVKNHFPLLAELLDRTPLRVIINTIHWQFTADFRDHMNQKMKTSLKKLPRLSFNPMRLESRHPYCMENLHRLFVHALSNAYVQKYFPKRMKDMTTNMVSEIAHKMKTMINSSTLLANDMKLSLFQSLKTSKWFVGYPDWYENKTEIDHYYDNIEISQSWLENMITMERFTSNRQIKSLREHNISRKEWTHPPLHMNAYFTESKHALYLSAAMLESPLFDENQPDALNYGITGSIVGHELTHAVLAKFRDHGAAKLKLSWYYAISKFLRSLNCFIYQYSNYTISFDNRTYQINSNITRDEDIADTTGVQVAYEAFQIHKMEKKEPQMKLPGLENLNSNQLFFLSYAQRRCESNPFKRLVKGMVYFHSPSPIRVIGPLSNSKHFADAFQCARGTKMNRTKKCLLF